MRRARLAAWMILLAGCNGAGARPAAPEAQTFPGASELDVARSAARSGKPAAAADALAEALRVMEDAGPLRILSLSVVNDSVRGYGLYTPLAGNTIGPGKPLLLYFEPAGMKHQLVEGGLWQMDLAADLELLDPSGLSLQKEKDFLTSRVTSRRPNREIQFVLRMQSQGMPEGDFIAVVTLRDLLGNKTATERIAFKVRIP